MIIYQKSQYFVKRTTLILMKVYGQKHTDISFGCPVQAFMRSMKEEYCDAVEHLSSYGFKEKQRFY